MTQPRSHRLNHQLCMSLSLPDSIEPTVFLLTSSLNQILLRKSIIVTQNAEATKQEGEIHFIEVAGIGIREDFVKEVALELDLEGIRVQSKIHKKDNFRPRNLEGCEVSELAVNMVCF